MKCGLEIHVQLETDSKLFCTCRTNYKDAHANSNICPVCLNQPGAKPYPPNKKALDGAIKIALMLGCEISPEVTPVSLIVPSDRRPRIRRYWLSGK